MFLFYIKLGKSESFKLISSKLSIYKCMVRYEYKMMYKEKTKI